MKFPILKKLGEFKSFYKKEKEVLSITDGLLTIQLILLLTKKGGLPFALKTT